MTFSFNFKVESSNSETISKTSVQRNDELEKDETVLWKEAKEHFVEERHRN